jgi:hypothetical protein
MIAENESNSVLYTIGHTETRDPKGIFEIYPQGTLIRAKYPSRYPVNGVRSGGGKRGPVTTFSRKARARIRAFLGTVRELIPSLFVTLTYGLVYPMQVSKAKEDLSRLWRGLVKKYPKASAVWLLHFQKRGAPHFHMIVWGISERSLRNYVKPTWHSMVMNQSNSEYKTSARVEKGRSLSRMAGYLSKPIKVPDWVLESGQSLGKCWGKKNEKDIPLSERIEFWVAPEFEYKIKRLYRRYLRYNSRKRGFTLPTPNQLLVVNPARWAECLLQLGYIELVNGEQASRGTRAGDRGPRPNNRLFGLTTALETPTNQLSSK